MNQPDAATASNKALTDSLEKHWLRCRKDVTGRPGTSEMDQA